MSLEHITERIENAWQALRKTAAINTAARPKLVAVSKIQPDERVRAVLAQGQRCFGENRVQEAAQKWPKFRSEFSGIELHLSLIHISEPTRPY